MPKYTKRNIICYFGTFQMNQAYSRNLIIANCLRSNGCKVIECRVNTEITSSEKVQSFKNPKTFILSLLTISYCWIKLIIKHSKLQEYNLMIVGYPSHVDVILGFILTKIKRRTLVMDAFIGLYDTIVKDRRLISQSNPLSKLIWLFERITLNLADKVMVDTQSHKEMLTKIFRLRPDRIFTLPVGIDENIWRPYPLPPREDPFSVALWSTFIPLHGMDTIVEAAALLAGKDFSIKFHVMGDGQTADKFDEMLKEQEIDNIEWKRGFFDIKEIVNMACNAHCCLGIFGKTEKAKHVVPYKVYQALALGRPVITADTLEMRAIFNEFPGGILVPRGDSKQLVKAILTLAQNRDLCIRLAQNARLIYDKFLSNYAIQKKLEINLNK